MSAEDIEKRLDKIEVQLAEINEVFQAARGGLKAVEFLGRIAKAVVPIFIFCGIVWGAVEHYFKK